MIEYIYTVDNRGKTPKCVKTLIVKRTNSLIFIDRHAEESMSFDCRAQFPIEICNFSELDAIRDFVRVRRIQADQLRQKLERAELDIEMCLKTMEAPTSKGPHENSTRLVAGRR